MTRFHWLWCQLLCRFNSSISECLYGIHIYIIIIELFCLTDNRIILKHLDLDISFIPEYFMKNILNLTLRSEYANRDYWVYYTIMLVNINSQNIVAMH